MERDGSYLIKIPTGVLQFEPHLFMEPISYILYDQSWMVPEINTRIIFNGKKSVRMLSILNIENNIERKTL